jgi:hypothetical protein
VLHIQIKFKMCTIGYKKIAGFANYEICSCGKRHVRNKQTGKIIKTTNGYVFLYNDKMRYKIDKDSINRRTHDLYMNALFMFFMLASVGYYFMVVKSDYERYFPSTLCYKYLDEYTPYFQTAYNQIQERVSTYIPESFFDHVKHLSNRLQ